MRSVPVCCLILLCLLFLTGCEDQPKKIEEQEKSKPQVVTTPEKHAPNKFWIEFDTSQGKIVVEVDRSWAPIGVDRVYELVNAGYYNECRFYDVASGEEARVGISGNPALTEEWYSKPIPGEAVVQLNNRGTVALVGSYRQPNSRAAQLVINLKSNPMSALNGTTPIGKIVEGMNIADSLFAGYGAEPKRSAARFIKEGNAYLTKAFPKLDYIKTAKVLAKYPAG